MTSIGNRLRIFALGGNQVSPAGVWDPEKARFVPPDIGAQWRRAVETCEALADIIQQDPDVPFILTHGNGPQVGNVLLRAEYSLDILHTLPLDVCGANTQGAMGYMLSNLGNALRMRGIERTAAETVTRVVVDEDDSEFANPTKFIGPAYTEEEAKERETDEARFAYYKKDEEGRAIWRRVVPSPIPKDIVEVDLIEANLAAGIVPIAAGGGGIPVVKVKPEVVDGEELYRCRYGIVFRRPFVEGQPPASIYSGREAVVDKDMSAAMMGFRLIQRARARGEELEAELVIITDVDCVKLNYQQPNEEDVRRLTLAEAEELWKSGAVPAGSMGPKVRAACAFIREGGKRVTITNLERFHESLEGNAGTIMEG